MDELTSLTVTNTAADLDSPPDTLTYTLLAAPTNANISAAGVITWTPNEAQGPGTNTFTTKVADNGSPGLSDTNTFTVVVNEVNVAPVLPGQTNRVISELTLLTVTNPPVVGTLTNRTVNPGQTISFTATATDADLPTNTLTLPWSVRYLVQPSVAAACSTGGQTSRRRTRRTP